MKLTVVSFKECWPDASGRWHSYGGFPMQMGAFASLFDETTLLITQGEPQPGALPLPESVRVVPLRRPTGRDGRRKLSVMSHLPSYLGEIARHVRAADAVHVPLPGDLPFLGLIVALSLRKRLIARYGGSWQRTSETTVMNRVTRSVLRLIAGGRNVVLATGEGQVPATPRMHWIFATALTESELCRIVPRLERGLGSPPQAVYAGRLSPEKGLDRLVRAVAMLRRQGFQPLPRVTLVGAGPERTPLEELIRQEGCRDLFQLEGQLDRAGLTSRMLASDFAVQPSLTEGFSKAWLDAMACGLPVLGSRVGAASAVIGDAGERGWLVAPGQADALASALADVIRRNRDWAALRRRCRAFAESRTLEAWARQIGDTCARQWAVSFDGGRLH